MKIVSKTNNQFKILTMQQQQQQQQTTSLKIKKQSCEATYGMVDPMFRNDIIEKINNGSFLPVLPPAGETADWTHKKHYPENKIPTRVYLLGGGKLKHMHQKYLRKYGETEFIEFKEFQNFTRELLRQGIMIEIK